MLADSLSLTSSGKLLWTYCDICCAVLCPLGCAGIDGTVPGEVTECASCYLSAGSKLPSAMTGDCIAGGSRYCDLTAGCR